MAKATVDTRFAIPKPLASHGPARIIALCNQKGGVGKTTTAINMSAALAEFGRKILLIDFDPQGALSAGLGINAHDVLTIYDLILDRTIDPRSAIQQTNTPNLDLIPANIELSAAEMKLVNEIAREQVLSKILKQVSDDYDAIIIDCQPSLGLLTVNALTAAHGVIIPLSTEFFALRGVAILEDIISKVKDGLNPALQLDGILPTMVDIRTLHSREVLDRLKEAFGKKLFKSVVHRTVKFPDATVSQIPITEFAPTSDAAEVYRSLAKELVARGCVA